MNRLQKTIALGAVASFAIVSPAVANNGKGDKGNANHGPQGYDSGEGLYVYDCDGEEGAGDNVLTFDGPMLLWPPNHRQVDFTAAAVDGDNDGQGTVTLVVTVDASASDSSFDPSSDYGGDADVDVEGKDRAEADVWVVRERAGYTDQTEGRVYNIHFEATFDDAPTSCSADFQVIVPHDMRKGNRTAEAPEGWSQP